MRRRLVAGLMVAVGLLGPTATGAAAWSEGRAAEPYLFGAVESDSAFSPNGDGHHERAQVTFVLKRAASVYVRVLTGPRNLPSVTLGRLAAGRHIWRWDGIDAHGKALPDRTYLLRLLATNGSVTSKAFANIDVRTSNVGTLATTRPVVYPAAVVVADHVQLTFVAADYDPYQEDYWGVPQARSRLRIVSRSGHVVWQDVVSDSYAPRFDWDAHSPGGGPLPAGRYVARLRTTDVAGNALTLSRPLTVSHAQLVEETYAATVPAASVATYEPYYDGCNGCGEVCSPLDSDRFAGGLSFRPCTDGYSYATRLSFAAEVPFAAAPVDHYRVSVTGGPTTPGATDGGSLVVGERLDTSVTGEGVTTSRWTKVDLTHQPNLPTLHQPVIWSFATDPPESYEVASFTIEYGHYVPLPSPRHQ